MGTWLVVAVVLGQAQVQQPETVTLSNGMTWLLVPRAGDTRVAGVVTIGAGSSNESSTDTGAAHFLEHLGFGGTPMVGCNYGWLNEYSAQEEAFDAMDVLSKAERAKPRDEGEIARLTAAMLPLEATWRSKGSRAMGGLFTARDIRSNAWTSADETTYFGDMPSELMHFWLMAEAQRFAAPVFREFRAERNVVLQEVMQRKNASSAPSEALIKRIWGTQGYGWYPGGTWDDVATMSPRAIDAFYAQHYTPGNAVGVLVGGFDAVQTKAWLQDTFGMISAREASPRRPMTAGPFGHHTIPMNEPMLLVAFPSPGRYLPGAPTADVVEALFEKDPASISSLCVVRHLCTSFFISSAPGLVQNHVLLIGLTLKDAKEAPAAEQALFELLAHWRPDADELGVAKLRVERDRRITLRTRAEMAKTLSHRLVHTGEWKPGLEQRHDGVTLDGVNAVLEKMTPDAAWVLTPVAK